MMASDAARAALQRADLAYAESSAIMAEHEVTVFAPLRGAIERNHIADKIKALFAA